MARLIIGHVTDTTASIWVRSEAGYPFAHLKVSPQTKTKKPKTHTRTIQLEGRHGFTGAITFTHLSNSTLYNVEVEFSSARNSLPSLRYCYGNCTGIFRTFPKKGIRSPFSFLLGSCNLHSLGALEWIGIADPDPAFEELLLRSNEAGAEFMIHCGDQIYYDIPPPLKPPDIGKYREKYVDAWADSRPTRKFLTQLPHYMIMDDHEITDNFDNDKTPNAERFRETAMAVYREFVHIRQPNSYGRQALYYSFTRGHAEFFVLDCRTERHSSSGRIIGMRQMSVFKHWLTTNKNKLKFVVTCVPFVGEVRSDGDKWNASDFRQQREEIIDHIGQHQIEKLVFLTGDMHNSYHATLKIGAKPFVIHELMSSPINQLLKSDISEYTTRTTKTTAKGTTYSSVITRGEFYGEHSNAMLISVNNSVDENQIEWRLFRTKKHRFVRSGRFVA